MEKRSRRTITRQQSLGGKKDIPTELMHRIQSLLSEKEAARTCVLSKSWLHAWSTIPNLRFPGHDTSETQETQNNKLVYYTLQRYHNHDLPIQTLDFEFHLRHPGSGEVWFRHMLGSQTTSCLKELSLTIRVLTDSCFTFSDDMLFSGEKLEAISLMATGVSRRINPNLSIGVNPVIKCVSLRVLKLDHVNVSEHVFHKLLSACRLLEKVVLCRCRGLKTIKVKNLGCLRELEITSVEEDGRVEIDKVPSLSLFSYKSVYGCWDEPLPFKTTDATVSSLGGSVTRLHLEGVIIDDTFLNMIASKFPFLERLELQIGYWGSKRLVITSLSLKRLALCFLREDREIDLQVSAPNLLSFDYNGKTLPTLLCPYIGPKQIKLTLNLLRNSLDISFFYKLREVLNLSSKFEIHINLEDSGHDTSFLLNNDDDVDGLRRWVSLSAANVQQLSLKAGSDDCLWDDTRFFDALFSVCHPVHVKALLNDDNKCFSKLMARWMMEKKANDLKDVQLKNCISGRWEPLTSSWECDVFDTLAETYDVEFKLDWFSDE